MPDRLNKKLSEMSHIDQLKAEYNALYNGTETNNSQVATLLKNKLQAAFYDKNEILRDGETITNDPHISNQIETFNENIFEDCMGDALVDALGAMQGEDTSDEQSELLKADFETFYTENEKPSAEMTAAFQRQHGGETVDDLSITSLRHNWSMYMVNSNKDINPEERGELFERLTESKESIKGIREDADVMPIIDREVPLSPEQEIRKVYESYYSGDKLTGSKDAELLGCNIQASFHDHNLKLPSAREASKKNFDNSIYDEVFEDAIRNSMKVKYGNTMKKSEVDVVVDDYHTFMKGRDYPYDEMFENFEKQWDGQAVDDLVTRDEDLQDEKMAMSGLSLTSESHKGRAFAKHKAGKEYAEVIKDRANNIPTRFDIINREIGRAEDVTLVDENIRELNLGAESKDKVYTDRYDSLNETSQEVYKSGAQIREEELEQERIEELEREEDELEM